MLTKYPPLDVASTVFRTATEVLPGHSLVNSKVDKTSTAANSMTCLAKCVVEDSCMSAAYFESTKQ